MSKIFIVSAAGFEITPIKNKIKKSVCFEHCGIGSLNAAMSKTRLQNTLSQQTVLFLGSCGSFYPFKKIELVTCESVYWLPPCERLAASWSIEGLHPPIRLKKSNSFFTDLAPKHVITSPTIAKTSTLPTHLSDHYDHNQCVENLELYPVVQYLLPVVKCMHVILAVTNELCEQGRVQWKQNHREAAELTCEYLLSKSYFWDQINHNPETQKELHGV